MRKKTLIIWGFIAVILIVFSNCQAAETQFRPKVQFAKHISIEPESKERQLRDIEARSMRQQQFIENYYQQRFEQLQLLAKAQAKKFTYPERMRWTEFIKMINQELATNNDLLRSGFLENRIFKLHAAMLDSYSLNAMRDFLLDENAREIIAYIVNDKNYLSSLLREQARRILAVMDNLQSQSARLEKQWDNSLANLEQWENEQHQEQDQLNLQLT